MIKLVNMLSQHILLVLHVSNLVLVARASLSQMLNLFVKAHKLTLLSELLTAKTAELALSSCLLIQCSLAVIDGLIDLLGDVLDSIYLALQVISHLVVLAACLLQALTEFVDALALGATSIEVIFTLLHLIESFCFLLEVIVQLEHVI